MSEPLSSFLITISIIAALALFVPCLESLVRFGHRKARGAKAHAQDVLSKDKSSKVYSHKIA